MSRRRFIERNAYRAWSKFSQVATRFGCMLQRDFARFDFNAYRVEEILVRNFAAKGTEIIRKSAR
jgi:hypothetical protein